MFERPDKMALHRLIVTCECRFVTTRVTVTGTGTPYLSATNAGPGVLVSYGNAGDVVHLQFDAGRATLMRLTALGVAPHDLSAMFLTHYHNDHLVGLADIVLSHWVMDRDDDFAPIEVVAPTGSTTRFVDRMLGIWDDDLAVRAHHNGRAPEPKMRLLGFDVPDEPTEVWSNTSVRVLAGQVRHEPVIGAVGYRVETPDGVIAISGDTTVCEEMAELSRGADVVVHEAMRMNHIMDRPRGQRYIAEYHADCIAIGQQMAALDTPTLMLTHLIPPPIAEEDFVEFEDQVREGGFTGELMVCRDLDHVELA